MFDFVDELIRAIETREPVALATIVGPFQVGPELLGRKLLVREDGRLEGSLGVSSLDEWVAARCREAIVAPPPVRLVTRDLGPDEAEALGVRAGTKLELFVEAMHPAPTLLVVGAGHIAQPLAKVGKILGFEVAVIDDRRTFANPERFPEADRLIVGDYGPELARFPINGSTYVVLVTRGHTHDEESLRQVIGSRAAYIGMIGSRRRVGAVLQHMANEGIPKEQIDRVYSPIGLDIAAETPEEIAVSILAEVVNARRRGGRHPNSMSARERANV